jgi:hypothetical protein
MCGWSRHNDGGESESTESARESLAQAAEPESKVTSPRILASRFNEISRLPGTTESMRAPDGILQGGAGAHLEEKALANLSRRRKTTVVRGGFQSTSSIADQMPLESSGL